MGWSTGFITALSKQQVAPTYRLKFDTISMLGTVNITSTSRVAAIGREGPTISGQRCIPQTWNITFGSWSVPVVGDISQFFPSIRKGSFAELYCTINGIEERITCGQLRNIKVNRNRFIFEFVDLISMLGSNYELQPGTGTAADPDPFTLMYATNKETFPTSIWSGGSGTFPSQLHLNDLRLFSRETSQNGVVLCVPASGEEFILLWSSKTITSGNAGYLTLAHTYQPTTKIYPTVHPPVTLQTTDKVYTANYLQGFPADIFAKLLLSSTGVGTTFQKYPPEMNSHISLGADFFDTQDAHSYKPFFKRDANVDYEIGYVVKSPLTNGWRSLVQKFAKAGHWPVWRQNSLSYRLCVNPTDSYNRVVMNINDSQIFSVMNHDLFATDQRNTFFRTGIIYQNKEGITNTRSVTTLTTEVPSLPVQSENTRDNQDLYKPDPFTATSDRFDLADADVDRMRIWDLWPWEKLQLNVTIKHAQLCCGDLVTLSSQLLYGVNEAGNKNTYTSRRALVIGVDYNISQGTCILTLAIPFLKARR
jgi:hypothetical protein